MKKHSWEKRIFIWTLSIIITHVGLAYHGLIENYEAFVCSLGYIAIAVLISTMIPDKDESRS